MTMTINWGKVKRISLHACFWLSYLLFLSVMSGYRSGTILSYFHQSLYTLPIDMSITYFTIYFLIPHYLLRKKYLLFFFTLIAAAMIAAMATRFVNFYYVIPHFNPNYDLSKYKFFSYSLFYAAYSILPVVVFASSIKILKFWIEERYKRMELEIQNQSSELALLRNQINPHFLFNTLNNIHTLITKDSNKASDALLKLSDIMRYMLYEASTDRVTLSQEIEYLKSYIELQKLRLPKNSNVDLKVNGDFFNHFIPPMLLISFVENAFKHGDKKSNDTPFSFEIESYKDRIEFKSSNSIKETPNQVFEGEGGIGLKNVQRRLDLVYKDRYVLEITNNEKIYKVLLILMV